MVRRPPVSGRARELADVRSRLAAAHAGTGGLLLLSGPPGIGKSALVQAGAALAVDEGLPVLAGRAADGVAPPLWAWAPVLAGLDLRTAATSAAGAGTGEDALALRFMAAQALAEQVVAAVPAGGLLVVLEDLHWADGPSLALLRALAPRLAGAPLLVVATHRPVRAGAGASTALADELPWLQAEPATASVRLGPLDLAAVADVLRHVLGEPAADALAEPVLRRTRGNALFVRTVALLLADLPDAERQSRLAALSAQPELADAVRTWTRGLPASCVDLLGVAGLTGKEVDVDALCAVSARPYDEVLDLLDTARTAGVLEQLPTGRPAFVHDVVRDVLTAELPAAQRAATSRALAQHLERSGAGPTEVARHWLAGARTVEERARAVGWARRAAEAVSAGADWPQAADLLSGAVRAATGAVGPRDFAALHLELAEVHYRAGDVPAALAACRAAAGCARELGDADLLAAAAVVVQGMGAADVNAALLELTEAALLAGPGQAALARVLAQRACALVQLDRTAEAAPLSEQALALARRLRRPQAELDAVRARHLVLAEPERHAERAALAERALALATELHQPGARMWALLWLVDAAFVAGDLGELDARLLDLEVLVPTLGLPLGAWHVHRLQAARAALVGDFPAARRQVELAVTTGLRMGAHELVGIAYAFCTELASLRGSADDLPADLETRLAGAPPVPIVTTSRALVDLLRGRREQAAAGYAQVLAGSTRCR